MESVDELRVRLRLLNEQYVAAKNATHKLTIWSWIQRVEVRISILTGTTIPMEGYHDGSDSPYVG